MAMAGTFDYPATASCMITN